MGPEALRVDRATAPLPPLTVSPSALYRTPPDPQARYLVERPDVKDCSTDEDRISLMRSLAAGEGHIRAATASFSIDLRSPGP